MQAILFDVDGVLVHGYTGQTERRRQWEEHLEADLGINSQDFTRLFIKGVFEKEVLTGRKALIAGLEETLPMLSYSGSPFAVAGYWLNRDSQLNFQLLELVRRLRGHRDVKLYIATNQEHMRAFHLWSALGLEHLFDDLFHSARVGALKPDTMFYQRIMEIIGVPSQPPIIVDDSEAVISAARAFGSDGVHYTGINDCMSHPVFQKLLA